MDDIDMEYKKAKNDTKALLGAMVTGVGLGVLITALLGSCDPIPAAVTPPPIRNADGWTGIQLLLGFGAVAILVICIISLFKACDGK